MAFEELHEYTTNFRDIEGKKPENGPVFLNFFEEYLKDKNVIVRPDGDGAYFGKQAIIELEPYLPVSAPRFEIAFDNEHIVVYTARHEGYWVPPYASFKKGDGLYENFAPLLRAKLVEYSGINLL